jgi:RHS repeat-associated protein
VVVQETTYEAFGSVLSQTGSIDNVHGFSTKERDSSGLIYFGARYYDPSIGRWITKDPLTWGPDDIRLFRHDVSSTSYIKNMLINTGGDLNLSLLDFTILKNIKRILILQKASFYPQNFHRYVYCNNNPLNYIDPWGLDPADLNGDGKVDFWDDIMWFFGRRFWDLINPPGMPYPPGYGDEGPGTDDPRMPYNRKRKGKPDLIC